MIWNDFKLFFDINTDLDIYFIKKLYLINIVGVLRQGC